MESNEGMNDEFILAMGLTKRKNHMRILEQKRDHRNTMKINAKYNPTIKRKKTTTSGSIFVQLCVDELSSESAFWQI